MKRFFRLFDWRFVAILIVGAIVSYGIWSGIKAANDRDHVILLNSTLTVQNSKLTAQNSKLIAQNDALIAEIKEQQSDEASQAAAASKERALQIQRQTDIYNDVKRLLALLQKNGIAVPKEFFTTIPSATFSPRVTAPSTKHHKGKKK